MESEELQKLGNKLMEKLNKLADAYIDGNEISEEIEALAKLITELPVEITVKFEWPV